MKTIWVVLISVISLVVLVGATLFLIGYFKPKPGGLVVEANVEAGVYINGQLVGNTPFNSIYKASPLVLKVVPVDTSLGLVPFETKLTLIPGIQTVVRREFGVSEESSSGDIISFEKERGKTSMVVISTPADASVSLDGVPRGFSPFKTSAISPGQHQVSVKAPGYSDRTMTVNTKTGYRLTVYAKLSKTNSAQELVPEIVPSVKTYIEILDTPTGFLRVRSEPGAAGHEIAQVTPGSKYLFLEDDVTTGWYKIQYQDPVAGLPNGIVGWVSGEYSKKVEVVATP